MMFLATLPSWLKWSVAGVLGVVLIAALFLSLREQERKDDKANQEIGETKAVNAGQEATLNQVERANDAEAKIRTSGDAGKYERCVRYSSPDTRANCAAFAPVPD